MPEDLAALLAAHRAWLESHGSAGARLDLADAPAGARDLRGADLQGADLTEADLTKVDLRDADLRGADLYGVVLTGADLRGADLTRARLAKADLSRVRADGVRLHAADLVRTDLAGAHLAGADLSRAYLARTDLGDADLSDVDLSDADLHLVLVDGSRWRNPRAAGATGTLAPADARVRVDGDEQPLDGLVALLVAGGAHVRAVADGPAVVPPPWRWRDV